MDCFIKKIFLNKIDEETHSQFVRFGKGNYENRAALSLNKIGSKVKVGGSFEYANDFVNLISELGDFNFSGIILSKEELPNLQGKKKSGIFEYEFSGNSQQVKEISDKVYFMFLEVETEEIKLKMKKKLPKPGKTGDAKIDDKFCILEADARFWPQLREAFFWDIPDCKKAKISHTYIINEIILPQNEKDPEKIRIFAKRKGRLVRKITIDKNEMKKEVELNV